MSKVKNEHIVPRTYLKYFSNKDNKLYVYDKVKNKTWISLTKEVAHRNKYYDLDFFRIAEKRGYEARKLMQQISKSYNRNISDDKIDELLHNKQYVEEILRVIIENDYSNTIERTIEKTEYYKNSTTNQCILSVDEKKRLSKYIAIQILRSTNFREHIAIITKISNKYLFNKDIELDKEDKTLQQDAHIIHELNYEELTNIICSFKWIICYNETNLYFITSDNPVLEKIDRLNLKISILFPVNPNILIGVFSNKYELPYHDCDVIKINDIKTINMINNKQIRCCERQAFSIDGKFKNM